MNRRHDSGLGCFIGLVLCLLGLPIIGVSLLCNERQDKKEAGLICIVVGVIFWVIVLLLR